jgi:hypothetical protein
MKKEFNKIAKLIAQNSKVLECWSGGMGEFNEIHFMKNIYQRIKEGLEFIKA